jgi:hypothetical protein
MGGESARADGDGYGTAQFWGPRQPLSRGLAESHTADGQGSPLEGLGATVEVVPLQQGLEDVRRPFAGLREAAGEAGLAPLAVDDDAHLPAFAFAAGLSGAHDQDQVGRQVVGVLAELGVVEESGGDAHVWRAIQRGSAVSRR